MQDPNRTITRCVSLLEQAIDLIKRLDVDLYSSTGPLSPRGSIGGHLRHILDFYLNFLASLESHRLDYNLRQRDVLIEHDPVYAIRRLSETIAALRSLSNLDGESPLLVSLEESGEGTSVWCISSVLRELDFLQSHTVHHFSLVAMLLRLHEIDPGAEFGVAASTLKYWKEEASCAQ